MTPDLRHGGVLAWFAANPVAANLLMLLIVLGGLGSFWLLDEEVMPRFAPHQISVRALYPGAGPLEIEESLCIRIEEAIYDLPGVRRLQSEIIEGECEVKVTVLPSHDRQQVLAAVRGRVQAVQHLPKNMEKIEVQAATREGDDGVIWVALHGPVDPLTLKRLGEQIQSELARVPGVSRARNYYEQSYEIAIEVASEKLRQYRLSLADVAAAVRQASVDLPGGLVKSPSGEWLLRVKGRAADGAALGELLLRSDADGSRVLLRDVARIHDGLEERLAEWHHNGEPAQGWEIHAERDAVAVARRVKAYVQQARTRLPPGIELVYWWDDSQSFDERIWTLVEDGLSGFVLVCAVLTVFLRAKVALWAGAGILTSVFGALWLMPLLGVSLNMLSLFGFLLAMGILVDDAIIIGEAVHSQQAAALAAQPAASAAERRALGLAAAISGVREVALPVCLAVSVALVAFLPGLFLPGWFGQLMRPICLVMILTLVFSLVEALLILPAHLAHPAPAPPPDAVPSGLTRLRDWLNHALDSGVKTLYAPLLARALAWRHLVVAAFAVLLMLSVALIAGGWVRLSLQADVTKDSFWVSLKLPEDAPYDETRRVAQQVERALFALRDALDAQQATPAAGSVIAGLETLVWEHGGGFWTELSPQGRQHIAVEDFVQGWRQRIGDIGRAKIDFIYKEGDVPYDIEFDLGAADPLLLHRAAERLKQKLAAYPGVFDVVDSAEAGKPEIRLNIKPGAQRLGVTLETLAEQARHAYYGEEVQRIQRGRSEVKIMVRLPRTERQSVADLGRLPIRLPNGAEAPLGALADIALLPGQAKLIRQDRQRVLKVQARLDPKRADANAVYADMEADAIPALRRQMPGLSVEAGEERKEQEATLDALVFYTGIALLVIYALIAVPFRSYVTPLVFLLSAPVAWCGGVLAHWLLGLPLSMESLVGMIAASGVVVNDSLVLLDYLREHSDSETPLAAQVQNACAARFRPILLAFLTNFAGFFPTLLETSEQAQFLIPMTLSLSAGLLLGMAASLLLTPVCYVLLVSKHR